jgi:plasmid maintenance system antidote protein VapI
MTEREWRDRIKKALRNARRQYRALDSHLEKMERMMDRLIERKTRITHEQALPLAALYDQVAGKKKAFEDALADFLGIAGA